MLHPTHTLHHHNYEDDGSQNMLTAIRVVMWSDFVRLNVTPNTPPYAYNECWLIMLEACVSLSHTQYALW